MLSEADFRNRSIVFEMQYDTNGNIICEGMEKRYGYREWEFEIPDETYFFRVRPDSHPLYEPQEGDLFEWGKAAYCSVTNLVDWRKNKGKIIMRNGKHFMWPCEIREESGD